MCQTAAGADDMKRFNVIITGMARSGTSMTSAIFANNGYFIGELGQLADESNPLGYFEGKEIVDLNVELLQQAGYEYHNTWQFEPVPEAVIEKVKRLEPGKKHRDFLARYQAAAPWVWKDIRLCFTLPFWLPLLDLETTRFILVRRRAEGVFHSIKRKENKVVGELSLGAINALIEQHITHAKAALELAGANYIEMHYERCQKEPEAVANELTRHTGLPLTSNALNVHPELNHDSWRDRLFVTVNKALQRPSTRWAKQMIKRAIPATVQDRIFPEQGKYH